MVICPKCKAENRPEAAFCVRCGTILFSRPVPEKPTELPRLVPPFEQPVKTAPIKTEPDEPAVVLQGLAERPGGSIFGERFKYDSVVIS